LKILKFRNSKKFKIYNQIPNPHQDLKILMNPSKERIRKNNKEESKRNRNNKMFPLMKIVLMVKKKEKTLLTQSIKKINP